MAATEEWEDNWPVEGFERYGTVRQGADADQSEEKSEVSHPETEPHPGSDDRGMNLMNRVPAATASQPVVAGSTALQPNAQMDAAEITRSRRSIFAAMVGPRSGASGSGEMDAAMRPRAMLQDQLPRWAPAEMESVDYNHYISELKQGVHA